MNLPENFYTWESVTTLSGAVTATFVLTNTARHAFGFDPRWLSLVISQLISLLAVYFSKGLLADYLLGIINGCLIYCTATGVAEIASSSNASRKRSVDSDRRPRGRRYKKQISLGEESRSQNKKSSQTQSFFSSWWH